VGAASRSHHAGIRELTKVEAPSFAVLTAIYAVGILSHILLDLVTSLAR